jgi:peptide/nickel transport system substrate-binding protein
MTMSRNYWASVLEARMDRRKTLAATGALAAGTAFLAACGGSDSGGGGKVDNSLLTKPTDVTKMAKKGGALKRHTGSDPAGLDPHGGGATVATFYEIAYARLFNYTPGLLKPSTDEIEGAHAESWEFSPDRLTLTAKLRQGTKFHNIAPVNGRVVDAEDILFSWKRFSTLGSNRTVVSNAANPDAPVLSVTAPDPRTIVIKFVEPLVYAQAYFVQRGYLNIVPKEAENTSVIDLRQKTIGSGPFMVSDYRASTSLNFKRHQDYWDKERPYIEGIDYAVIPEYAQNNAQFRAGNIHAYEPGSGASVRQEEVVQVKKDVPELLMYQGDVTIDTRRTIFGWQNTALRDKRVRQALSMSIDRDSWLDAQYNTSSFESQGLPITKRWNTALEANDNTTGWWLDPKDKAFGANAKYFERNVAEAKKLLAAAGFADGVELISNHFTTSEHGPDFVKLIELWEAMTGEAGFKYKKNIIQYTDYLRNFRDTQGKWSGVSYKLGPPAPSSDPTARLTYEFSTKGGVGFHGFDVGSKGDQSGDPLVEEQLKKARGDFETERRRGIVHELQRYLADQQYTIRWPGGASGFELAWPAVRNYRVYRPGSQAINLTNSSTWWLDESLPPFKKG